MSDFIETAREELKQRAESDRVENEQVRNLITSIKGKVVTIKYENVEIRVPASIPHEVKSKAFEMTRLRKELEDDGGSLSDVLEPTYEILANLCLDHPWNQVDTWRTIEEQTGASDKILLHIMDGLIESDKKIKKFR